jgi:hypothetical protein
MFVFGGGVARLRRIQGGLSGSAASDEGRQSIGRGLALNRPLLETRLLLRVAPIVTTMTVAILSATVREWLSFRAWSAIGLRIRLLRGWEMRLRLWLVEDGLGLRTLLGGCESVHNPEIVLVIFFFLLGLIRRTHEAVLRLLLRQLSRCDQAEVVLCMLKITFRHHRVAGRMGVPRQLQILLCDVVRCSSDFDVWPI